MKDRLKLACVCWLFTAVAAHADTFEVPEIQSPAVDAGQAATVSELIRANVAEIPNQSVVARNGQFQLRAKLLKLGNSYVVTLQKVQKDQVRFASQLKATTFDDMDNVVARLVRSVVTEKPVDKDATVKDVTTAESTQGIRRRETVNRWYFGMGPGGTINAGGSAANFNLAIGYYFEIDPSVAVKIVYDGTSSRFNYLNLGANYYFSDKNYSPVVTGELGYGSASQARRNTNYLIDEFDKVNGFILGAGAGYQFFRTSKVNLEILAHFAVMMNNNDRGVPSKYGLRVGVYW